MRGIHRWPANSPHKGPVTRKIFPFDDIIIWWSTSALAHVRDRHLNGKYGVQVLTRYPRRTNSTSTRYILVYFLNKDKCGVWQHTDIPLRSTLWWIITMMKNQHWKRMEKLIEVYSLSFRVCSGDPCGIWRGTSHKCGCQLCHKPETINGEGWPHHQEPLDGWYVQCGIWWLNPAVLHREARLYELIDPSQVMF